AREMPGAAVIEIVAVDRGHDDVVQPKLAHRLADPFRLVRVERVGPTGRDIAKGAGPRAGAAEDHHGRVLLLPALTDIRAGRLLADSVEPVLAHEAAGFVVFGRARRLDPDPGRLARTFLIGKSGLFRVADRSGKGLEFGHGARCGARGHTHQARSRASFPRVWGAGRRSPSARSRSSPRCGRSCSPGSAR